MTHSQPDAPAERWRCALRHSKGRAGVGRQGRGRRYQTDARAAAPVADTDSDSGCLFAAGRPGLSRPEGPGRAGSQGPTVTAKGEPEMNSEKESRADGTSV